MGKCNVSVLKVERKRFYKLLILPLVRCFSNFIRHIHIIHLYINISKGLLTSGDFSLICPIIQVCECGDGYLFLGSRLGNSLLVKYTEKAQDTGMSTTFSKHVCLSAVISREQKSCYLKQWHSHHCVELTVNGIITSFYYLFAQVKFEYVVDGTKIMKVP